MLKKLTVCLLAIFIVISAAICVYADEEDGVPAASGNLAFNSRITAGNIFTVSFIVNAEEVFGVSGRISYDSEKISYVGVQDFYGTWSISASDKGDNVTFIAIDTMLSSVMNGECRLFDFVFKVNDNLAIGTEISLTAENISLSDGKTDIEVDDFIATAAVDKPLSSDASLYSLDIGNFTSSLEPEFSPYVNEYSLSVPFETEMLDINYTAHEFASVNVGDSSLSIGKNTVTITVTSESGDTSEKYVINILRSEKPVIPSSDASVSSIEISDGSLTPEFSPDILDYTLKVDYGISAVEVNPIAANSEASVDNCVVDCNKDKDFTITCTAGDGTVRTYHFVVEIERDLSKIVKSLDTSIKIIAIAVVIAVALLFFIIGFIIASVAKKGKKDKKDKNTPNDTATEAVISDKIEDSEQIVSEESKAEVSGAAKPEKVKKEKPEKVKKEKPEKVKKEKPEKVKKEKPEKVKKEKPEKVKKEKPEKVKKEKSAKDHKKEETVNIPAASEALNSNNDQIKEAEENNTKEDNNITEQSKENVNTKDENTAPDVQDKPKGSSAPQDIKPKNSKIKNKKQKKK